MWLCLYTGWAGSAATTKARQFQSTRIHSQSGHPTWRQMRGQASGPLSFSMWSAKELHKAGKSGSDCMEEARPHVLVAMDPSAGKRGRRCISCSIICCLLCWLLGYETHCAGSGGSTWNLHLRPHDRAHKGAAKLPRQQHQQSRLLLGSLAKGCMLGSTQWLQLTLVLYGLVRLELVALLVD